MAPSKIIRTTGALADSIRRDLAASSDSFLVPHLLDVEVLSALRNLAAGQRIDSPSAVRTHDAAYIALAEATNSVL